MNSGSARAIIFSPNLALDHVVPVAQFESGAVLRAGSTHLSAGGKGIVAARTAGAFGLSPTVVGFRAGAVGRMVNQLAKRESIRLKAIKVGGQTRVNTAIIDPSSTVTVINGLGPTVDQFKWRAIEHKVMRQVDPTGIVACTGSLPPGVGSDAYGRILSAAKSKGAVTIVDVGGPTLEASLRALPAVAKVNLDEAESCLKHKGARTPNPLSELERAAICATAIHRAGASTSIVTVGPLGCVASVENNLLHFSTAKRAIHQRSAFGAGDAFLGALISALRRNVGMIDAIQFATAAAAASVENELPGQVHTGLAAAALGLTQIRVIED